MLEQAEHTVQKVDEGAAPDCAAGIVAAINVWGADGRGGLGCVLGATGGGGVGRGAGAREGAVGSCAGRV